MLIRHLNYLDSDQIKVLRRKQISEMPHGCKLNAKFIMLRGELNT